MTDYLQSRRLFLQSLAVGAVAATANLAPQQALAESREAVIEAAKKESGLLWYDHYDHDAVDKIFAAFRAKYPFVKKTTFIDVPSAQKTARIVQESTGGGPTSDVLLNSPDTQKLMFDRGFLHETDWGALGVKTSPATMSAPYMLTLLTPLYVIIYNTNQVKAADVPKSWEDAVADRWKGKTGHWMRAAFFNGLVPQMGEQKVRAIVGQLASLKPRLFSGLYPLAQAVGSGELALAITAYDSAIRVVQKGAPVKLTIVSPASIGVIAGGVPKFGKNPNTARLFLSWLATPDGAITFEKNTRRGNAFVEGTEASKLVQGQKLSYYTPSYSITHSKKIKALEVEFSRKLAGR